MLDSLNDQARRVLAHARDEARLLNHSYIGTEHLLLGLLRLGTPALQSLDLSTLRREIANLIKTGAAAPPPGQLPLTPRANAALDFAAQEARFVSQKQIGAEHLLLGLFREPDSVAGQVLRTLGVDLEKLRLHSLKTRLTQMTIVERIVRPLRATTAQKRRIREELLAHLETIYDQEFAQDPAAALRTAAARLGNPAELTRQFADALPLRERLNHRLERLFGWRFPETIARFMARLIAQFLLIMVPLYLLAIVSYIARFGWDAGAWVQIRTSAALLLIPAVAAFLLGILHFKLRDTLWGALGSRKSTPVALTCALLIAVVALLAGYGAIALIAWSTNPAGYLLPYCSATIFAALLPALSYLHARLNGPTEITDTRWASLDLHRFDAEFSS